MQVVSVDMETDRVHVRAKPHIDIDLSTIYGNWELAEKYYTSQEVCHKLRVSNLVLSRISSSCSCEETKGGRYEITVNVVYIFEGPENDLHVVSYSFVKSVFQGLEIHG